MTQQMSMADILSDKPPPEPERVEETVEPAASAPAEPETQPAETHADEPAAESVKTAPESEPAEPAAPAEPADFSDIPEAVRRTLEAKPEDAENWRNLRTMAKDAQAAAREAAEQAAALRAEKARLEAEVAAFRSSQVQQQPAQPAQPQQPALPDPELDPAGYAQALIEQKTAELDFRIRNAELNRLEADTVREHGREETDQAFEWAMKRAQADAAFGAQFGAIHDPWSFAVREYKRAQIVDQMGDDPQAYIRQQIEAGVKAALAEQQAQAGQASAAQVEAAIAETLPSSLAKVPGASGSRAEPVWTGPPPLDSFVGPQKAG